MSNIISTIVPGHIDPTVGFDFPSYMKESNCIVPDWVYNELFFSNILRKNPIVRSDADPEGAAWDEFWRCEYQCRKINTIWDRLTTDTRMKKFFLLLEENLRRVLGDVPALPEVGRITSGATTNRRRGNSPLDRFTECEITPELFTFLEGSDHPKPWISTKPRRGSTAMVVPKTWKVGRLVCTEPAANAYEQGRIGLAIYKRLKLFGIDIQHAQEMHRFLAEYASIWDEYSTLDSTSASALIAKAFIDILPPVWASWINATRSHYVNVPFSPEKPFEHYHSVEQLATMGNGFCFELETVLFFCIIHAANGMKVKRKGHDVYVFGDDCIFPTYMYDKTVRFFRAVGFMPNESKSFKSGFFKESCGADFLYGQSVRPVFIKNETAHPFELTVAANQVYSKYCLNGIWKTREIRRFWLELIRLIPVNKRLWGPIHLGDKVLMTHHCRFYKIRQKTKWSDLTCPQWRKEAISFTDIGKLIHRGAHPDLVLKLASGGFLRGQGLVWKAKYLPNGDKNDILEYSKFPDSGTRHRTVVYNGSVAHCNGVDELLPLTVFDVLSKTKAPKRLWGDYVKESEKDKEILLQKLCNLLHSVSQTVSSNSIEIDATVDYLDDLFS